MTTERTKLVLGRGELYFNPFAPGSLTGMGEIYIGNTPEFVTSRQTQSLPVADSFDGQKIAIDGPITREEHSARFTTDHIDAQNVSLWYGGDPDIILQNRQSAVTETLTVYRGRFYQLGTSPALPMGARGIEDVVVKIGATTVAASGNFEVDKALGRIHTFSDAADIEDGDVLSVIYEQRDVTSRVVVSRRQELFGSLRFVARNPVGENKNYFYPFVKLSPTGDIDHKASDWQRISFEVEAQRRNPLLEYLYIDQIEVLGLTVFEYAIIELSGITIETFPLWEDRLNTITNTRLPANNYHLQVT